MSVDTSRAAVERLTRLLTEQPFDATAAEYAEVAATLRALLAERDALRAAALTDLAAVGQHEEAVSAAFLRGWEAGREAAAVLFERHAAEAQRFADMKLSKLDMAAWGSHAEDMRDHATAIRALTPPEAAP